MWPPVFLPYISGFIISAIEGGGTGKERRKGGIVVYGLCYASLHLSASPLDILPNVCPCACSHFLFILASRLLPTHHETRVQFYQLYRVAVLRVALTFHRTRVRD